MIDPTVISGASFSHKALTFLAFAIALSISGVALASPYIGTAQYFVEPGGWSVGDVNSTYQVWDDLSSATGNTPDVGFSTNPAIASLPTLGATPGYVTGSGNFYRWDTDYTIAAEVDNHNTGGTDGTHIIVQTTATANESVSVVDGTTEIVDLGGSPILGGANGDAFVNGGVVAAGTVSTTMGPQDVEVLIWEFFLPGYTGDFQVRWLQSIHSSFDQLRIDSMITPVGFVPTQFTFAQIPEPGAVGLVLLGLVGVALHRRGMTNN